MTNLCTAWHVWKLPLSWFTVTRVWTRVDLRPGGMFLCLMVLWSVFTSSGVASAKQTGHCGLTATVCSGAALSLLMSTYLEMLCFWKTVYYCYYSTKSSVLRQGRSSSYFDSSLGLLIFWSCVSSPPMAVLNVFVFLHESLSHPRSVMVSAG